METPTFTAATFYRDPKAALEWLAAPSASRSRWPSRTPKATRATATTRWPSRAAGRIMIGGEWADWTRSPASVGGINTQSTHVNLASDLDAHCERARAAGATIVAEPEDQFYGDRTYRAADPEGHVWTFSQHVRDVTRVEAEEAIGLTIEAANWT